MQGAPVESVLERWRHLAAAPQTIVFPEMELLAGDWEPSIVRGNGEIRFTSPRSFEYTLHGTPEDAGYTLKQMKRQRENRYDGLKRFRLIATAHDGAKYTAGWTIPSAKIGPEAWTFTGECEGLMTDDDSVPPTATGGTDVQFIIPPQHRASLFLEHFVSTVLPDGSVEPTFELSLGDAALRFRFDAKSDLLTITVPGSDVFPLTYTEVFLGEPLRILFGQLAYPRLVARSFPKGGAMIRVSPAPAWHRDSDWTALWDGKDLSEKARFWELFGDLLLHIARAKEFEGHKITKLYEEVIQASGGSRWVWALTFASSIEALTRMLSPAGSKRAEADYDAINSMVKHIGEWDDKERSKDTINRLKTTAVNAVHRTAEATPRHILSKLCEAGVITAAQVKAWEKIRNAVMHGSLVSRYSSEEDDAILLALAALMHALTKEIVRPTLKWT